MVSRSIFALLAIASLGSLAVEPDADTMLESPASPSLTTNTVLPANRPPIASSIDLGEVFESPSTEQVLPKVLPEDTDLEKITDPSTATQAQWPPTRMLLSADEILQQPNRTRQILGVDIPPATATRLVWKAAKGLSGMAIDTPVLVVNGAADGPSLCLTAAIHGDELNGIEMIRRVMYDLDADKLHGTVIGVPIVNLLGFSRRSRYLPDRRDLNRHFPGNPDGSVASRIANAFFTDVMQHCNMLLDIHTGSFYRTNIPQLRADMKQSRVVNFVELFGDIPVLNSMGNNHSLRAAAVRAGIPAVTLEAGEPMRLQKDIVKVGVNAIKTLMAKSGMYAKVAIWRQPKPAFYTSSWVRANSAGILFSRIALGDEAEVGDILGTVSNPISNEKMDIVSPHRGRVLGMALDQFVMPGFAVYHIGIHSEKQDLVAQTAASQAISSDLSEDALGPDNVGVLRELDAFNED